MSKNKYLLAIITILLLLGGTARVSASLAGPYNVGSGQTYTTITEALTAWKDSSITGNVTFTLMDATYPNETYPLVCTIPANYVGGNWTLTVKPVAPCSIVGSNATAIFDLNGIQRLTIDGAASGTNKNLTISNTNASGTATIRFINGASYNTVKNCILKGVNTPTTSGVVVFSTGIGGVTGNNDNVIENCDITRGTTSPVVGIFMDGSASPLDNRNNTINGCNIFDFSFEGICIASNALNTTITRCDIYTQTQQTTTILDGISLNASTIGGTKITNNKIHDFWTSGASPLLDGIYLGNASTSVNTTIANNFISIDATRTHINAEIYGIEERTGAGRLIDIYYNSIYIGGSGLTTASNSYGIYRHYATVMNVKNNIIFNKRTQTSGTGKHYCFHAHNTGAGLASNYNDLYAPDTLGGQRVGYWTAEQKTLAAWRAASSQDANSISKNPGFQSATDLHINPDSTNVADRGTPISGITIDFDGDTRNATFPDIGGDEYVHGTPGVITLPSSNVFNQKLTVNPNPFTKLTTIRYTVPVSGKVAVKLYNATGRLIETLNDGYLNAGTYTMRLSSKNLAKGVYFLRYETMISRSEIKLIMQ